MIAEISFWKQELKYQADSLKCAVAKYQAWDAESNSEQDFTALEELNFQLERGVFYSAFAIRRMLEAHKWTISNEPNSLETLARCLPENLLGKSLKLQKKNEAVGVCETISYRNLVSEIIHSSYLSWHEVNSFFRGFWLASERNEPKRVLLVTWPDFQTLLTDFYGASERT